MTSYPSQLNTGTVLGGRYQIGRLLGSGTMGTVFEAVQLDLRRAVAVKVLRPELVTDPASLERFRREALAAAALGHPNIVQVTDFQHPPGEPPFLVMEKLDGHSLQTILSREARLAPARVAQIALQILSALSAAHRAGIVHRDVKPDNVFLVRTPLVAEFVKVLDFGVAKINEGPLSLGAPSTAAGLLVGTLAYMAPEQAASKPVDGRADVYALGAVMYTALSGRRVFNVDTVPAMLMAIAAQAHVPLVQLVAGIDPRLSAVIDRALAKDANARFASADEMAAAIAPFAQTPSFAPPTVSATGVVPPSPIPVPQTPQPITGTLVSPVHAASGPPGYAPPTLQSPQFGQKPASNTGLWIALAVVLGLLVVGGVAAIFVVRALNVEPIAPQASASASATTSASAAPPPPPSHAPAPHDAGAHVVADASAPHAADAAPPPSRVKVALAGQSNQDYYDPAWLEHNAAPRKAAIEACYGAQPTLESWDKEACWDLHFDAQGNVYTVDQLSARISPPLEKCVAGALAGIKLGPPPKKPGPGDAGVCVTVK